MSENEKYMIADAADMIVGGYAFSRYEENIRVVNLNKAHPGVMLFTPDGVMLESSMDPIEETIALQKWQENREFMEEYSA